MLPFERDNLSDAEGRISRSFVSFELPGPGWEWITPWTVEVIIKPSNRKMTRPMVMVGCTIRMTSKL